MKTKNIIVVLGILLVLGFFIKPYITGKVVSGGTDVTIPLSEITEQAKWYNYVVDRTTVSFFVVKANDGSIKTAFDACDVCYGNKKGYRQEGDYVICNNCGNKYPITSLGTENLKGGGCWPGYLPTSINKGDLVIKENDLKKGSYKFE